MIRHKLPTRNEMNYTELAEKMFGSSTSLDVEVISLKILVSALSVLLLEKGICSRKELQQYVENSEKMYYTLKALEDKNNEA